MVSIDLIPIPHSIIFARKIFKVPLKKYVLSIAWSVLCMFRLTHCGKIRILNFTQILRETNFGKLRVSKTDIFTISKATIENYGKSKKF